MGLCDAGDHLVPQQLGRMTPAAQGIPALDHDAQILDIGNYIIFLVIGVDLILHQRRGGGHLGQKFLQLLHIPVGQADGADFSLLRKFLHRLVCFHVVPVGVVEEHHVHIADVQPVQARLDRPLRVRHFAPRIDFRYDENVFPFKAQFLHGLPDGPTHFLFVAVGGSGVNESDTAPQGGLHGVYTGLSVEAVGSQTIEGHFIAAVEGNGLAVKIEYAHCVILLGFRQIKSVYPVLHLGRA